MLTIYAFANMPPPVVGVTRDLRALWTAEEARVPYRVHALDHARGDLRGPEYVAVNPFGLVPAIDDDGLVLFESGAIVLHIAAKTDWLLPASPRERAHATQWAFAAVDTMQSKMTELFLVDKFYAEQAWAKERRPGLVDVVRKRLTGLDRELGRRPYLLGEEFTAPDILMSSALREIQHTDLLGGAPNVAAYKTRCEARPAWRKIYAAYEQRLAA
ncbi:MAG TPA: glutathione S-transferase family protein [Gammaproteobacteria bacterium]|nr:glutathione S-transferase family protein [Gammaproteobacteria bacterium]